MGCSDSEDEKVDVPRVSMKALGQIGKKMKNDNEKEKVKMKRKMKKRKRKIK